MRIVKTNYVEIRESVVLQTWDAAKTIAFGLLESGYKVAIGRQRRPYSSEWDYTVDFINPEWDGADFEITGDRDEFEQPDGSVDVVYKQSMNSISWDQAEKMAQSLVDSDYNIYIWTDGETFGGTQPKNYTIHFAHVKDEERKIRLVE